jgi:hypothetical protein
MGLLADVMALSGYGQAARRLYMVSSGPGPMGLAQGQLGPGEPVQGEIVREIDDPSNGDRWLLVRNDQLPGGPGRMVRIAAHRATGGAGQLAAGPTADAAPPVIRSGERLLVEEHTARVDAVLEARALTPAAQGAVFAARLTIGGMVVRVVALGPGRAALQVEVRP